MRVLLSSYGPRGDVEPMVGLAVRSRALGAEVRGMRRPTSRMSCAAGARRDAGGSVAMTEHAVVIVGGGPTGLILAGELALAGVDAAIIERP